MGPSECAGLTDNWHGHIPFARWLVRETQPSSYVELGVFKGDSYLAVCEAVLQAGVACQCWGVDSWEGDEQAGPLANDVYSRLKAFHDARYGAFSELVRGYFDDALRGFADGSVDLLHIDGLHTYEAVRHDFETWLPKVSKRGVVLFHDSAVTREGFGVHRFFAEVREKYPSFEFRHSHGLGVLAVGTEPSPAVKWLTSLEGEERDTVTRLFSHIGAAIVAQTKLPPGPSDDYAYVGRADPVALDAAARDWHVWGELRQLDRDLTALRGSASWRWTAPLRRLMGLMRGG